MELGVNDLRLSSDLSESKNVTLAYFTTVLLVFKDQLFYGIIRKTWIQLTRYKLFIKGRK